MTESKYKNKSFRIKGTTKQALVKTVKPIKSWRGLLKFYQNKLPEICGNHEWIFRGDNPVPNSIINFKKNFKSKLDKAFDEFSTQRTYNLWKIETELIREFRRKSPLFSSGGKSEDQLECLALMQHYEAPTRMLDWTYSFFAAVYFAINNANKGSCGVWALDSSWLEERSKLLENKFIEIAAEGAAEKAGPSKREQEKISKQRQLEELRENWPNKFQKEVMLFLRNLQNPEFSKKTERLVYPVNPYYLNERLSIQRGVLLFPGDIGMSWGENLKAMLKDDIPKCTRLWMIPIEWNKNEGTRKDILKVLYDMNISQATLFPDLGGFAKSLRTRIAHPDSLRVKPKSHRG
jgi:hypothetical protein